MNLMKQLYKILSTIILIFIVVIITPFIHSQDSPLDGFANQLDDASGRIEDTADNIEQLTREESKWQYLGEKWKEYFLKNPVVAKMDELFSKGNLFFVVLFGRDYALSLTLLFLIILWFYFFIQFNKIIGTFSTFSYLTSTIVSLGMTIILAQLRFFNWASEMIFKLIFFREGVWGWIWVVGGFLALFLTMSVLGSFFSSLKKSVLKFKDENYRKKLLGELEEKNKFFAVINDAFRGMFEKD